MRNMFTDGELVNVRPMTDEEAHELLIAEIELTAKFEAVAALRKKIARGYFPNADEWAITVDGGFAIERARR